MAPYDLRRIDQLRREAEVARLPNLVALCDHAMAGDAAAEDEALTFNRAGGLRRTENGHGPLTWTRG